MKAITLGLAAACAVLASSAAVWRATGAVDSESEVDVAKEELAVSDGAAPPTPAPAASQVADRWRFEAAKSLLAEGRLGHRRLPAERNNETYLYFSARAPSANARESSTPLNVAIVIDRSGSMRGKRLRNAVAAAKGMVERLRDGDTVSVLTYNTATAVLVAPTDIEASDRQQIAQRLDGISAVGDTCISCALDAAMDLIGRRKDRQNRILLLSDGQATAGIRDVAGFRSIAAGVRQRDCSISSVGVDADYNEQIMTAVAQESNGHHYFVDDPTALARVFDQELESLMRTVARNASLSIELAPGVRMKEVFDRTYRRDGGRLVVPLGSFTAGENKTLLARLEVERGQEGERSIAAVRLTYDDADGSRDESSGELFAVMTADPDDGSELDPLVAGRLSRAETAKTLREANQLFSVGQHRAANHKLVTARTAVRRQRKSALPAASRGRRDELNRDFDRQVTALDDAYDGFANQAEAAAQPASPARKPMPAHQTRPGRVQVRQNAAEAFQMAY